ncbi:MAG: copper transporter [Abditibacteriota bacterium]|nr:copper transporter [Abditibacteriota bacterium]
MIDLKFHVYSIAGIFLALAIGMIIGNAMNRDTNLTAENSKIMKRYADTVNILKKQLDDSQLQKQQNIRQMDADEAFIASVAEKLNRDSLTGRNITLVSFGKNENVTAGLKKNIEQAGGAVINTVVIKNSFINKPRTEATDKLLAETGQGVIEDTRQLQAKIYGLLAKLISEPGSEELFKAFSKSKIVTMTGDFSAPCDSAVLIIDSTRDIFKDPDSVTRLASSLKNAGVFAAGADSSGKTDTLSVWDNEQIPYADNADSALGAYSVVRILADKQGIYGLNGKTGRTFPDTE